MSGRQFLIGRCRACAPAEWPSSDECPRELSCARHDDGAGTGSLRYTYWAAGMRCTTATWPSCEECEREYCPDCGAEAWYQMN